MRKLLPMLLALLLLAGCNKNAAKPSLAVAEALSAERQQTLSLSAADSYAAENLAAWRQDGKTVLHLYSAPIEGTGNAVEAVGNTFVADGSYFLKEFPQVLSAAEGIRARKLDECLRLFPEGEGKYTGSLCTAENLFGQERKAIVYPDVFGKGCDLTCYPTAFGVNTEITLPNRKAASSYRFRLQLPVWVPDTNSPDYILFRDASDQAVKAILCAPLLGDRNGKWSYANTVQLVDKDSETGIYTVEYTLDSDFLADKGLKYPLTLNQSLHFYYPKQPDTSAYSDTGNKAGHYLSPYMLLGDSTEKGEGWTYIRYETLGSLDIPPEKLISARYVFRNLFDLEEEAKLGAYAVTADWCSINTRWFNRPPFDEKPVAEVIIKERGDYSLDITPLLREILQNKGDENAKYSVQNSFLIRSDTPKSSLLLASGDNGLYAPLLEIVLSE